MSAADNPVKNSTKKCMCECGKGYKNKWSLERHQKTVCKFPDTSANDDNPKTDAMTSETNSSPIPEAQSENSNRDKPRSEKSIILRSAINTKKRKNEESVEMRLHLDSDLPVDLSISSDSSADFSVAADSSSCRHKEERPKMIGSDVAFKCQIGDAHSSDKSSMIMETQPNTIPIDLTETSLGNFTQIGSKIRSKNDSEPTVKYRDASTQTTPCYVEFRVSVFGEEQFAFNATPVVKQ